MNCRPSPYTTSTRRSSESHSAWDVFGDVIVCMEAPRVCWGHELDMLREPQWIPRTRTCGLNSLDKFLLSVGVGAKVWHSVLIFHHPVSFTISGDHTEVIEIDFDPTVISLQKLLDLFWNNHEYGLGTKIKKQYCSLILYHNEEQRLTAERSLEEEREKRSTEEITTKILPASTFYPAEE